MVKFPLEAALALHCGGFQGHQHVLHLQRAPICSAGAPWVCWLERLRGKPAVQNLNTSMFQNHGFFKLAAIEHVQISSTLY